jgi:hypothetical protein
MCELPENYYFLHTGMAAVLPIFQQHYIALVNDDEMYANFLAYKEAHGEEVDVPRIKKFIVNTDSFENRVFEVINRVYPAFSTGGDEELPRTDVLRHCVDTFRMQQDFSVAKLTDMLRGFLSSCSTPRSHGLASADTSLPPPPPPKKINHARSFVRAYEDELRRPMYAYELLCLLSKCPDIGRDEHATSDVSKNVRSMYHVVSDVALRFEGRHISEHDFAKDWLEEVMDMEGVDIVEALSDRMMNSQVYVTGMQDRIRAKFQALFGEEPSETDVCHAFAKASDCRMHLLDDGLDAMLTEVWAEKKQDVDNIMEVFNKTYGRNADIDEVDQRVAEYRDKSCAHDARDYASLNEALRVELCNQLEYRDVVKQTIQNRYLELRSALAPSRVLYGVLKSVLEDVPHLHDSDALRRTIDLCIRAY